MHMHAICTAKRHKLDCINVQSECGTNQPMAEYLFHQSNPFNLAEYILLYVHVLHYTGIYAIAIWITLVLVSSFTF